MRSDANSGLSWRWPSRFSKRSVRGRVSTPIVGTTSAEALSLCVNSMPPRITEKSYRPRASDRTMVDTRSACSRFRNRPKSTPLLSLLSIISERSSPSRVRSAAPHGAPWAAPGRSEQTFPLGGKARLETSPLAYHLSIIGRTVLVHTGTKWMTQLTTPMRDQSGG